MSEKKREVPKGQNWFFGIRMFANGEYNEWEFYRDDFETDGEFFDELKKHQNIIKNAERMQQE